MVDSKLAQLTLRSEARETTREGSGRRCPFPADIRASAAPAAPPASREVAEAEAQPGALKPNAGSAWGQLTPELSRAVKRRRLGRIVRP